MSINPLKNISLQTCRKFLQSQGCALKRTSGGHEHWTRSDLLRPITIQSHIDPVPERIMKQIIQSLGMNREEFKQIIQEI